MDRLDPDGEWNANASSCSEHIQTVGHSHTISVTRNGPYTEATQKLITLGSPRGQGHSSSFGSLFTCRVGTKHLGVSYQTAPSLAHSLPVKLPSDLHQHL